MESSFELDIAESLPSPAAGWWKECLFGNKTMKIVVAANPSAAHKDDRLSSKIHIDLLLDGSYSDLRTARGLIDDRIIRADSRCVSVHCDFDGLTVLPRPASADTYHEVNPADYGDVEVALSEALEACNVPGQGLATPSYEHRLLVCTAEAATDYRQEANCYAQFDQVRGSNYDLACLTSDFLTNKWLRVLSRYLTADDTHSLAGALSTFCKDKRTYRYSNADNDDYGKLPARQVMGYTPVPVLKENISVSELSNPKGLIHKLHIDELAEEDVVGVLFSRDATDSGPMPNGPAFSRGLGHDDIEELLANLEQFNAAGLLVGVGSIYIHCGKLGQHQSTVNEQVPILLFCKDSVEGAKEIKRNKARIRRAETIARKKKVKLTKKQQAALPHYISAGDMYSLVSDVESNLPCIILQGLCRHGYEISNRPMRRVCDLPERFSEAVAVYNLFHGKNAHRLLHRFSDVMSKLNKNQATRDMFIKTMSRLGAKEMAEWLISERKKKPPKPIDGDFVKELKYPF